MKKKLLTITLMGTIFTTMAQNLLTETFDAATVGNFATPSSITYATNTAAQNGWTVYSFMTTPVHSSFQITNVASGDNRLALSGSPTAPGAQTGSNYVQKSINWSGRTTGNDVVYAECVFNTGALSTSKNEFYFSIYNTTRLKSLGGFVYVRDTKVLKGMAYDSTGSTTNGNYLYSSIGLGGTSLVLNDNTDYYFVVGYDVNTGKTSWYVSLDANHNVPLCNSFYQNTTIVTDPALIVMAAKAGSSNASSSTSSYDEVLVQARPCFQYTTKANADFSYASGLHCEGGSNLASILGSNSTTGIYTSSPVGLSINSTTGLIDLSNSLAGIYTVKLVTNNSSTCVDSTVSTIVVTASVNPTFSFPTSFCSGSIAPSLPLLSANSISGTWLPSIVDNSTSNVYVFTPNSGTCAFTASTSISVLDCAELNENESSNFAVYPNPVNEILTVSIKENFEKNSLIRLLSSEGKVIEERSIVGSTTEKFNVALLKSGIYFVEIGSKIERIVIY